MNTGIAGMTALEILRSARATLEPDAKEHYAFGHWTSCTCGHIYAAAAGHEPASVDLAEYDEEVVRHGDSDAYYDAMMEICIANGLIDDYDDQPAYSTSTLTQIVSDEVASRSSRLATQMGEPIGAKSEVHYRLASVQMLDAAIKRIEARHERDRLRVLDQTRRVIEGVTLEGDAEQVPPVEVTA